MKYTYPLALLASLLMMSCTNKNQTNEHKSADCIWLIASSAVSQDDYGISVYSFNQENGEVDSISSIKGISNPTFFDISKDGKRLYAVSENDYEKSRAYLLEFNDSNGDLAIVDSMRVNGAAPCYITVSPDEKYVITANYSGGNISILPLASDGIFTKELVTKDYSGVGVDAIRQEQPHIHCVRYLPNNRQLLATDLGLDCIHVIEINSESGNINITEHQDIKVEPISGPRHIEFDSKGNHAYVINELSGMVTVFDIINSTLVAKQYIESDTVHAMGSGDIHLSPDNKFLYSSNRLQDDGLAIFKVDSISGMLERVGSQPTGKHPRNFTISPNGKFVLVASRDDNRVEIYRCDESTGLLTDTNRRININSPVCLKFNQ